MFAVELAVRRLARTPVLSVTLILSLGIGAGASTAIFTLANHLILKPRSGVLDPAELVDLGRTDRGSGFDLAELDPNLPLLDAVPLAEATRLGLFPQRLASSLAGGLGVIGLLLVLMGVYGVTAHAVQRRTRELGIRAALGARPIDLMRLMLREGMAAVLAGVLVGLTGAPALTHLVGALLYGISPLDPASFAAAAALLLAFSWLASYRPARRATRLEPARVLRHQ